MSEEKKIEFSTSDVINALLHRGQSQQHLATQESVDNLRRENEASFDSTNSRISQVEKSISELKSDTNRRFDKLDSKLDRLQWFIVAAALAMIFKDQIFKIASAAVHF